MLKDSSIAIVLFSSLFFLNTQAQTYKDMMDDMKYSFHEVTAEADRYFETHSKGKGSGYTGYQRWKFQNEDRYGPSGIRNTVDPNFVQKGYLDFINTYGEASKTNATNGWKDLGPYSIDSVTTGYNPGIGRVESFYIDPTNEAKIYLASRSGGFWRSLDSGATWTNTTDFLVANGVKSITASPTNSDSVLIALQNANNGITQGIYRSIDGGVNWDSTLFMPSNLGWGITNKKIRTVKISPHNADLIVIASSDGLYVSTDNLLTWSQKITGDFEAVAFHPTDANYIYTIDRSISGVVQVSSNGGTSFSPGGSISGGATSNTYLCTSAGSPNSLYVASGVGVSVSHDKGSTFSFLNTLTSSVRAYAISDTSKDFQTLGYLDNFSSSDGGQNFNQYSWWSFFNANTTNDNYVHADSRYSLSLNGNFYLGTDGYLAVSTDNLQTWKRFSGYGIREYYRVGLSYSKSWLNMCGSQDNGTSILDTSGWFEWNGGDGMEAVIHPLNEKWMIGSWQFGNRNRTTDAGLTRNNVKHSGSPYWDAPMLLDPNNHMTIYSFADEVYRTDDFATNWTTLGTPSHFTDFIRDAAIAENNSKKLALASYNDIALTIDGGNTFTDITVPGTNQYVSDLAFDPNNDNTIIAVYGHHWDYKRIFISQNSGATWTDITHNLMRIPIHCVVIDTDGNIYLGGEKGVYTKTLSANTWSLYDLDLPRSAVKELEIHYATNTLRAATWGRGLWEAPLIGKKDFPKIVDIETTVKPDETNPMEAVPVNVTSVVSYSGTIQKCYIKWSVDQPTLDSTIEMTNTKDSTWASNNPLPDSTDGTKVFFKVFAEAANGDLTSSHNLMYTIQNNPAISIPENQLENSFSLYPNPATEVITIEFKETRKNIALSVFDMSGKEVYQKEMKRGTNTRLTISEWPAGIYSMQVRSDKGTETQVFIKH
jgi:hypothetical protein